jgi:3-isopropylmalate/(R)-2-methylmalate dehydratase small subunit
MEPFTTLTGLVVPLDRSNVDTDAIIPKQFLKSIERTGYGPYLFDSLRYEDVGEPGMDCTNRPRRMDFELNQDRFKGAKILLARDNFGCGSSREHAPWALNDYGITCLIAPSFADIFYNNCFKNGILPITLDNDKLDSLFAETEENIGYQLTIDLPAQTVCTPEGICYPFEIDEFRKYCLVNGLDDIDLTLQKAHQIESYENERKESAPWLF